MRQHIPNFFTLSNLFCGCCAVVFLLHREPVPAAWLTLGSFLCDYADGMVARALGVSSPMGRELDSLADVVSFGVVPGAMLYQMLYLSQCGAGEAWAICTPALPAFVLTAFSAYRLAKFNLDTRQKHYFVGLSTPGCTLFVLGVNLSVHDNQLGMGDLLLAQPLWLYAIVGVFSYLLVSEIPMYGLKIRSLQWRGNELAFLFIGLSLAALIVLKGLGLSLVILFYIALSVFSKNKILSQGASEAPAPL